MLDLAQSKNWTAIKLKGTEQFKQKAWLEASLRGIETKGYTPSEKDLAQLQAVQETRTTNQVEAVAVNVSEVKVETKAEQEATKNPTIYEQLQVAKDDKVYLDKIGVDFEGAKVEKVAISFDGAREEAKDFTGKKLTNFHSGITAIISNKNLDKMLSGKAEHKSTNKEIHAIAVANADKLFENSVFAWQSSYKNDSPDIEAVHRAIAPMSIDNQVYLAKLTVKEMTREQGNRVYSIEALEIDNEKSIVQK